MKKKMKKFLRACDLGEGWAEFFPCEEKTAVKLEKKGFLELDGRYLFRLTRKGEEKARDLIKKHGHMFVQADGSYEKL